MVEDINKKLDDFVEKVVKDSSLESPSLDFTNKIMSKIETITQSEITVYRPLISKRAWFIIATLIIGGLTYLTLRDNVQTTGWFDSLDYSLITNNKVTEKIGSVMFSKTFMYAITFFAVVFFIQIPILKNYFDKRLEY
ncbi:MAG: hypothetical protein L3J25_11645 [Flavobacteriaceae bacterium]|nr:hypothetical protein [Flavobacteriaceae bacterium]